MKKVTLLAIILLTSITSFAHSKFEKNISTDEITIAVIYKLFPTDNMWTFIKLNTSTGQMWQVQYGFDDSSRIETVLNVLPLVEKEQQVQNRFTLYPTQNTWNFILLDQINGNMWQVQWSLEPEYRGIIPID